MTISMHPSRTGSTTSAHGQEWVGFFRRNALWLIPVVVMLLITPFTPYIDLYIAKFTYVSETTPSGRRISGFFSNPFFDFLYLYGVLPAQITCGGATLILLASLFFPSLKKWRQGALLLSLTLALGSGIIAHSMLKQFWVRPRPRQIVQFGGRQIFCPYYKPLAYTTSQICKSFPSGHSTTGFYFFALYFLGKRLKRPSLSMCGLVTSFLLGGLLSIARIVQGGHFASDACIAALIMWLSAYFLDYLIFDTAYFRRLSS